MRRCDAPRGAVLPMWEQLENVATLCVCVCVRLNRPLFGFNAQLVKQKKRKRIPIDGALNFDGNCHSALVCNAMKPPKKDYLSAIGGWFQSSTFRLLILAS